jgi:hypothetical protein
MKSGKPTPTLMILGLVCALTASPSAQTQKSDSSNTVVYDFSRAA